jgi:hypothetical protein
MPRLGALEGQLLSDDLSDLFNLQPKTGGFLVKTVAPGSPGEAMGIKAGRKTATIDGQPLVVGGGHHPQRRGHRGHDRGRPRQDPRAHEPARRRPGVHDGVARGAAAEAHPQDAVNA